MGTEKKERIDVIVQGRAGSGKSTILEVIEKALKEHGIQVETFTPEEGEISEELFQTRLDSIRDKVKIELEERQLTRLVICQKKEGDSDESTNTPCSCSISGGCH